MTWIYRNDVPADLAPLGAGCAGSLGTPNLTAAQYSLPWLGDLFSSQVTPVAANGLVFFVPGHDATAGKARPTKCVSHGLGSDVTGRSRTIAPMRAYAIVALLPFLAACSTTGTYAEPVAGAAAAIVLGESRSMFAGLKPLGQAADIRIQAVDGATLSKSGWDGYPDTVRVAPGMHELAVRGSLMVDGQMGRSVAGTVQAEFAAGQTYRLRLTAIQDRRGMFVVEPMPAK